MVKQTFSLEVVLPFEEPFSNHILDLKADLVRKIVRSTLIMTNGNRSAAARILKIDRSNLLRIIRDLKV